MIACCRSQHVASDNARVDVGGSLQDALRAGWRVDGVGRSRDLDVLVISSVVALPVLRAVSKTT